MNPAADKLQQQKWHDALPDEQKALQHLLRAEATFRQIQVAFGNQRRRRWWWRRRARSCQPVRSRTRHGEEPVRDRADRFLGGNSARSRKSTTRCRSSTNWRAASRNSRNSATTTARPSNSAGSRKCCAARRNSCSGRWSRWPKTSRTEIHPAHPPPANLPTPAVSLAPANLKVPPTRASSKLSMPFAKRMKPCGEPLHRSKAAPTRAAPPTAFAKPKIF